MKKEEKSKIIEEISEKISKSKGLVLADFTRMTVAEVNELRRELKSAGVDYKVVKNTLLKIAMQNVGGYDGLFKYLEGPTAVAFGYDDPITPVRLIKKIKGKIEKPSVKAIFIEGQVYDGSKLDELANFSSRIFFSSTASRSVNFSILSTISSTIGDGIFSSCYFLFLKNYL